MLSRQTTAAHLLHSEDNISVGQEKNFLTIGTI
jgi:hypothetical protein